MVRVEQAGAIYARSGLSSASVQGSRLLGCFFGRRYRRAVSTSAILSPTHVRVVTHVHAVVGVTDSILEYIPAPATRLFVDPLTMGWQPCGHVNAFFPIHEKTVWPVLLDYVRSGKKLIEGGEVREFAAGRVGGSAKL